MDSSASADRAKLLLHIFWLVNNPVVIYASFLRYLSDCVKGYYKRAKAHAAVWNEKEARRDFNMVAHLDTTLASLVGRELKAMSERMKEKYWEERERYWNMLEKNGNKDEEEEEDVENKKGNKEDSGHATRDSEDEAGEEKSKECSVDQEVGLLIGSNKKEPSLSEMNSNSSTEGKDWQQMLQLVMLLQNEGNGLIKAKQYQDASVKYKEALEYVDILQNMVSANDNGVMFDKSKQRSKNCTFLPVT